MRLMLLILAFPFCLFPTPSSALTLVPTVISSWSNPEQRPFLIAQYGNDLATLDGRRSTLVYDFTGINPAQIESMFLRMVPIRDGAASIFIEAIGLANGAAIDPFVWTLQNWTSSFPEVSSYAAEAGPCYTDPASCPARLVGGFGMSKQPFQYPAFDLDVTDAAPVLAAGVFLQLSILPGAYNQFGRPDWPESPYQDGGAILEVTLIPEPATALLLGLGLAGLALRRH